ncbi:ABC transporter ATP-binding protein [Metabacillus sp. YM-086]|uniref:ABC transporter ATP-binding protein n=1 Tax=Metabacillus TaxID=2675233 RepID=UPI000EF5819C|nr:ABC transporter ATP-binding protein [Metabacillus litoralis]MCM3412448.1 ABC transporter ATP-binding protein/permease [Metabacillus litoralis]
MKLSPLLVFLRKLHNYSGKILYINLFGSMLMGLLESAGILLLIPLLSAIGIVEISINDIPGIQVFNFLENIPTEQALLIILFFYVILVSSQALLSRNIGLREIRIHTGFINHIRLDLYCSLLKADWEFFTKRRKSDLVNSLTSELGRVTNSTFLLLQFLASLVFTVIQIVIALFVSVKMTLFVLCCGLIITFLSKSFFRRSRELGKVMNELSQRYLAGISDHFNGVKDIKSNLLEASQYRWLSTWSDLVANERYESAKVRSNSKLTYKLFSTMMIALFIYISFNFFQSDGALMLLIIMIFTRLWPRFTGIQSNLENISSAMPAVEKIMELQESSNKSQDLGGLVSIKEKRIDKININDSLECSNVFFRYNDESTKYILEEINLKIRVNQMTAIVGKSGAGKSTLIDILMGFLKPESGTILIDNKKLSNSDLLSLRNSISYVPQDPFLFHGTIRDNLLMIKPDSSEEELWEAMDFSSAAEFVRNLPNGLDTLIGDRGIKLSGGERQRIVLARAILKKPSILILDEATSALDSVNEMKIKHAIEQLKGSMTVIVIAHRLSTIRNADQILVIENGKIVQSGGYDDLANDEKGLFSELLGNQLKIAN